MIFDVGFMCCAVRDSGFKVALVVGYPMVPSDKLRVRLWRAVSQQWTQPRLIKRSLLRGLNEADYAKHRRTIKRAADSALAEQFVKRVWS